MRGLFLYGQRYFVKAAQPRLIRLTQVEGRTLVRRAPLLSVSCDVTALSIILLVSELRTEEWASWQMMR